MPKPRTLSNVGARVTERAVLYGDGAQQTTPERTVTLYGFADDLASRPMVTATLDPREARQLAIALLKAAQNAEDTP